MKPTLLRDWEGSSCDGWMMSEKYDGWRGLWTGSDFVSRQGKVFNAPDWFKDGMPGEALDGELFLGRGGFNGIQGAMAGGWHGLQFMVFDAPGSLPFVERLEALQLISLPDNCELVVHEPVTGDEAMRSAGWRIVMAGGEGVVVRDPRAIYKAGRTSDVLRFVPRCPSLNRGKRKTRLALL